MPGLLYSSGLCFLICIEQRQPSTQGSQEPPAAWQGRSIPVLRITQSRDEWTLSVDTIIVCLGQLLVKTWTDGDPGILEGGPLFSMLKAEMQEALSTPRLPDRTYTQWIFTNYGLYQTQEHFKAT